ncbi:MAG: hypothetical protein VX641_00705 [Planctomycetota bacterium]|nr:hypothetical protein [Planctomycetota bacterium]
MNTEEHDGLAIEIIEIDPEESHLVATKLAHDPSGLAATGNEVPGDIASMRQLIKDSLRNGRRLWRVPLGDDYYAAIVGDDPFDQTEQRRLFIWLEPSHRGDDLGIRVVAEAVRQLECEGRERLVALPPRSNYAALRIFNALEFTYLGESDPELSGRNVERVIFEHRPAGGVRSNTRLWR